MILTISALQLDYIIVSLVIITDYPSHVLFYPWRIGHFKLLKLISQMLCFGMLLRHRYYEFSDHV